MQCCLSFVVLTHIMNWQQSWGCQLNGVQLTSLWDLKHLPSYLNDMLKHFFWHGISHVMSYETCSMQFAKWMSTVSLLNSSAHSFVCMQKLEYQWMDIIHFNIAEFCKQLPRNSNLYFDLQFYQCFSMMTYLHVWSQTFSSMYRTMAFLLCASCFMLWTLMHVRRIKLYFVLLEFCMPKYKSANSGSLYYNHILGSALQSSVIRTTP